MDCGTYLLSVARAAAGVGVNVHSMYGRLIIWGCLGSFVLFGRR